MRNVGPVSPGGDPTLSGDVTGAGSANTVTKVRGIAFAAGTPNAGDFKVYDGSTFQNAPLTSFVGTNIQSVTTSNDAGSGGSYARDNHAHMIAAGAINSAAMVAAGTLTGTQIANDGILANNLAVTAFRYLAGIGLASAGAVTLTGSKVGDKVVGVLDGVGTTVSGNFESTITVANQIQQTSGVLTAHTLSVLLIAKGG